MEIVHEPVMARETLEGLLVEQGALFVDGTVGEGGHAEQILEHASAQARLIGLDRDSSALSVAKQRLRRFGDRVTLAHDSYANLGDVLERLDVQAVSGIVLDLGFSSFQMDDPQRGLSFTSPERLDMRFDATQHTTAYDLINGLTRRELKDVFREFGEERFAGKIASSIVAYRARKPVTTALELAAIVKRTVPARQGVKGIHPATRVFQALRIAVNRELEHLDRFLQHFPDWLEPHGRVVIIAYHSLEDRAVKNGFRRWAVGCRCPKDLPQCVCGEVQRLRVLTSRPLAPSEQEVARNPRARSAKMRVAERI